MLLDIRPWYASEANEVMSLQKILNLSHASS
jgi:hypothetical protein